MNSFRHIFIAFLCLLAASSVAQAQNDWDSVLDRYEKITLQCMSLRDKAAAGERVSQKSVTELFGELNRLRNSLQQASGKMTAKQRERFRRVRESYDGKMDGQDGALRLRSGTVESRSGTVDRNTAEASSHQPVGERSRTAVGEQSRIPVGERSRTTVGERSRTAGRSMVEPLPKVEGWPVGLEILRSAQNDIKEVRGRGLMIGVEFDGPIAELRRKLLFDKHIFTGVSGKNMIRLLAPLVLTKDDVDIFIKALEELL